MLLTKKFTAVEFADSSLKFRKPLWMVKVFNYEYWPWWFFYLPLLPYVLWMILRTGSVRFVSRVNPSMKLGGLAGESKKDILDGIASKYKPKTFLFSKNSSVEEITGTLGENSVSVPFIAKPNIGERGYRVEKIHNETELIHYLQDNENDFIIQEYVNFPLELGIFYVRQPGHLRGKVTSVTQKVFMTVHGDGYSTIRELMEKDDRSRFQIKRMSGKLVHKMEFIPYPGEEVVLEHIGNHCRGTRFVNANHLINDQLCEVFDNIATSIPGFYYGRFDLRVKSVEDLYQGESIRILELNGISSEPGHIYDPSYSLLNAYRDIIQHWKQALSIALKQ